jgi:hypothetical protein
MVIGSFPCFALDLFLLSLSLSLVPDSLVSHLAFDNIA